MLFPSEVGESSGLPGSTTEEKMLFMTKIENTTQLPQIENTTQLPQIENTTPIAKNIITTQLPK